MRHLVERIQTVSESFNVFVQSTFALIGIILISMLASNIAQARNAYIFDVKRNIPMSEYEPIYKDYYINAGKEAGLKKNLVFDVVRYVSLKDLSSQGNGEDLVVPVGQLKVLFVQNSVAVARLAKLYSREDLPTLDQVGIMVGDRIDLKNSFLDRSPARKPSGVEADLTQDTMQKVMPLVEISEQPQAEPTLPETAQAPQSLESPPREPAAAPAPVAAKANAEDPNLAAEAKETAPKVIEVPVQVINTAPAAPVATSELSDDTTKTE